MPQLLEMAKALGLEQPRLSYDPGYLGQLDEWRVEDNGESIVRFHYGPGSGLLAIVCSHQDVGTEAMDNSPATIQFLDRKLNALLDSLQVEVAPFERRTGDDCVWYAADRGWRLRRKGIVVEKFAVRFPHRYGVAALFDEYGRLVQVDAFLLSLRTEGVADALPVEQSFRWLENASGASSEVGESAELAFARVEYLEEPLFSDLLQPVYVFSYKDAGWQGELTSVALSVERYATAPLLKTEEAETQRKLPAHELAARDQRVLGNLRWLEDRLPLSDDLSPTDLEQQQKYEDIAYPILEWMGARTDDLKLKSLAQGILASGTRARLAWWEKRKSRSFTDADLLVLYLYAGHLEMLVSTGGALLDDVDKKKMASAVAEMEETMKRRDEDLTRLWIDVHDKADPDYSEGRTRNDVEDR